MKTNILTIQTFGRFALATVMTLTLVLAAASKSYGAHRGTQAVVFPQWDSNSVQQLASIYRDAGGVLGIEQWACGSYANLDSFVKNTLADSRITQLVVRNHLIFERWDFPRNDLWAFGVTATSLVQSRASAFNTFSHGIVSWAQARGLAGKLRLICIPVLEDHSPSNNAYIRLLSLVRPRITAPAVTYARSPISASNANNLRIPGVAWGIELHSLSIPGAANFGAGDTWSNDGGDVAIATFASRARTALATGVDAYFWHWSMNWSAGQGSSTPLSQRRPNPLAESTFKAGLLRFLRGQ